MDGLEAKLRQRYLETLEAGDPNGRAVESALNEILGDKEAHEQRVNALQAALATQPEEPPTDAMLDVYNAIAQAVRGAGGDEQGVSELNERLRAVFDEFRVDQVDTGVVGVLPVLRSDFIEQYRDTGSATVMTDYENAIPTSNLPESSPAVLWATDPPPVKALAVPTETGRNAQA